MKTWQGRAAGHLHRGAGIAGTMVLHAAAVTTFLLTGRDGTQLRPLPAYRVELVAAPRSGGDATVSPQPSAVSQPEPPRPAPKPAPTSRQPVRQPVPARPQPTAASTPRQPVSAPSRDTSKAPGVATPNTSAAPGTGADPATIRTEGVEFPYPGYLRNLVAQVYRRWRPPAGNQDLEAEMLFFVHRDGTISGLQFVKRSGTFAFDLEAQGAIEAAARSGAFGPLPAGFGPDLLPVSFFFSPRALR